MVDYRKLSKEEKDKVDGLLYKSTKLSDEDAGVPIGYQTYRDITINNVHWGNLCAKCWDFPWNGCKCEKLDD